MCKEYIIISKFRQIIFGMIKILSNIITPIVFFFLTIHSIYVNYIFYLICLLDCQVFDLPDVYCYRYSEKCMFSEKFKFGKVDFIHLFEKSLSRSIGFWLLLTNNTQRDQKSNRQINLMFN